MNVGGAGAAQAQYQAAASMHRSALDQQAKNAEQLLQSATQTQPSAQSENAKPVDPTSSMGQNIDIKA